MQLISLKDKGLLSFQSIQFHYPSHYYESSLKFHAEILGKKYFHKKVEKEQKNETVLVWYKIL